MAKAIYESMKNKLGSILVIDDDADLLGALDKVLDRGGFEVVAQSNGKDVMDWLSHNDKWFDAVITDLQMPGVDGMQLMTAIKTRFPGVPVIMITGMGDADHYAAAIRAGASAFLPKPFRATDVVDILRRVMAKQSRQLVAAN